jgi:hypothetical protein
MNWRDEMPSVAEAITGIVLFGSFIIVLIVGGSL